MSYGKMLMLNCAIVFCVVVMAVVVSAAGDTIGKIIIMVVVIGIGGVAVGAFMWSWVEWMRGKL